MSDYGRIREFETEILDKVYQSQEFYQYSEDIVIPYLLQVYGDLERYRDRLEKVGHAESAINAYLNNLVHGISHCIRWIKSQNQPKFSTIESQSYDYIHEIANDFAYWGVVYHAIAQEFIIWSRGIKSATLDEKNKIISFDLPEQYDYRKIFGLQRLYKQRLDIAFDSYPHQAMERTFPEWLKEINLRKPPIAKSINWTKARHSELYPLMLLKMEEIVFPELPSDADFGGYSLIELRQFFALFFLNFYFIRWIEAFLDSQSGKNIAFGSNPLYLNKGQFIKLGCDVTGLESNVVGSIIDDFTFDHNNFHSSISIQPFILSSSGFYYILPNLFSLIEPSRMIVGALNKGPKKKIYDKFVNQIEKMSLKKIGEAIKLKSGWKHFIEKTLKHGGKQFQPDIIIIEEESRTVCVVDYKHYIGPITASEVQYRMNESEKAISRIDDYIAIISVLKAIGHINVEGFEVVGMLLTHKPLPIPIPSNTKIYITDVDSLASILNTYPSLNIPALMAVLKQQDVALSDPDFNAAHDEIDVGEWKIRRMVYKKRI